MTAGADAGVRQGSCLSLVGRQAVAGCAVAPARDVSSLEHVSKAVPARPGGAHL